MTRISRRAALATGAFGLFHQSGLAQLVAKKRTLPLTTIFKGESKYSAIVTKAVTEDWKSLPIGNRIIKVAREIHGTPYENFTLEIDDHIESPSVNLLGVDCWTFFEISLGIARMIAIPKQHYTPEDLLRQIEFTRYRGGTCTGNYLERIHYLAEWFFENDARGTCRYLTPELPGATRIYDRRISEMTILWKSYRYLKNNPDLRDPMKEWEARVAALPVTYIPKDQVATLEPQLQDGDVIGIATKHHGGFCSHVGLAIRTDDGVTRFMHASRNYRKVVIDKSVSGYLNEFSSHAGILVGRPLEIEHTVTDPRQYQANLQRLIS
ncbi:MAG: N-acetylmuramoyl-L-alanine amidase-like domain-containing protein [Verrucomicrobiota bacterium]